MARIQLVMPDADRNRFVDQARREGMSISAWFRAAAHERLERRQSVKVFETPEDVQEFFRSCEELAGPDEEPNWIEHQRAIGKSRATGVSGN